MKNSTILLGIIFLALYFGYPKYEDHKFKTQLREHMKKEQVDVSKLKGLPIQGEFENNYPQIEMRFKLTEAKSSDLPAAIKKKLRQEVKALACRNLNELEEHNRHYIKAKTEILEEDKVSIKIVLRDQAGDHISEHTQVLSQCANFDRFKDLA